MSGGPCIGVCMMDDDSDLCLGCGRSAAEIAGEPAPPPPDPARTPVEPAQAPREREGGQ